MDLLSTLQMRKGKLAERSEGFQIPGGIHLPTRNACGGQPRLLQRQCPMVSQHSVLVLSRRDGHILPESRPSGLPSDSLNYERREFQYITRLLSTTRSFGMNDGQPTPSDLKNNFCRGWTMDTRQCLCRECRREGTAWTTCVSPSGVRGTPGVGCRPPKCGHAAGAGVGSPPLQLVLGLWSLLHGRDLEPWP